jgi:hypothetical protein
MALSVFFLGIEHVDDIIADIEPGLAADAPFAKAARLRNRRG